MSVSKGPFKSYCTFGPLKSSLYMVIRDSHLSMDLLQRLLQTVYNKPYELGYALLELGVMLIPVGAFAVFVILNESVVIGKK